MTKRALVSCAAFSMLGLAGCSSGSNPTLPPGAVPHDGGSSERGATLPPDLRPPEGEAGASDARDASDVPLSKDGPFLAGDSGPPSIVTVTILSPAAPTEIDGGASTDGGPAMLIIAGTDRLAPTVRVDVQSQGGDPTADAIVQVKASLVGEAGGAATSTVLNQTQYEIIPEGGNKISYYGDTPLNLSQVDGGYYELQVVALTAGGVSASASFPLYIDVGPAISFLQPADGTYVKGSLVVSVIVMDSRAEVASVEFSVGQVQIPSEQVSSKGAQHTVTLDFGSFNPPLDGPQVVTVTATNSNGNVSLASRKFTVDNDGPSISGTKPAMGQMIGTLITVEANVSDNAGVMEGSVLAVFAHGDVHFEVRLEKTSGNTYQQVFDTTQLPEYTLFPSVSFRAQDKLGNQSAVGYLLSLDNTPPILDLDPPENFRLYKNDGTCSWPFDPVGPDAVDDGSVVTQLFDIRARIEDEGNMPLSGTADFIPIGLVDQNTVKVYILDDTSLPLVVDSSDPPDGICDDINPELIPSVSPQSSRDAQVLNLVPLSPGGSGDFTYQPGVSCSGTAQSPPKALCRTTYSYEKDRAMTYSIGYASSQPSIWTVPPIVSDGLQCAGRQFDASNNLRDGWACAAAIASDKLGNKQVSPPIRICVAAQPNSTACTAASSGGADIASVQLPGSVSGSAIVTTKEPVLSAGGSAVAAGDSLVFTGVGPTAIASLSGSHSVEPLDTSGTQFRLTALASAPYELWIDMLDGSKPISRGPVGLLFTDGGDVRVVESSSFTGVEADFAGAVVLLAKGDELSVDDKRWIPVDIQTSGFALQDSAISLSGFATAVSRLPNCTGTVVKDGSGGKAVVDGSTPCGPWRSFPEYEGKLLD